jgi:aspartate aminotransferase
MPSIAKRARQMPASPIRKLMPLAEAATRRGVRVLHLNIGQPDIVTPEAMRRRLERLPEVLAYSPSGGTAEFLAAMRAYYARLGAVLEPGQLIATTGGSEALLFALLACSDEGGEVLTPEPFYTNYAAFAAIAGLRLAPLTTHGEHGFHLPARDAWEAALTPRTRAILLCNPNNPTGTVYSRREVLEVSQICADRDLFLVVDEVYREFVYDGRAATSALALPGVEDRVIVVDSLSKRYSACGIRLGCLVTRNAEVHDACLRMAQARLSPPGLAQLAALGIGDVGPDYTEGVVTEYQRRRDVLFEGLGQIPGVFLRKPEGAFYFVARLPVDDSEDFARWLLTDFEMDGSTVMVAPAAGFYATPGLGRDEVRIAYVLKEADLAASVRLIGAALERYRRERELPAI